MRRGPWRARGVRRGAGCDFARYGGETSWLASTLEGAGVPAPVLDAGAGISAVTGWPVLGPATPRAGLVRVTTAAGGVESCR